MRQLKTQLLDLQLPLKQIHRVLPLRVLYPMIRYSVRVQTKRLLGHLIIDPVQNLIQPLRLRHNQLPDLRSRKSGRLLLGINLCVLDISEYQVGGAFLVCYLDVVGTIVNINALAHLLLGLDALEPVFGHVLLVDLEGGGGSKEVGEVLLGGQGADLLL